MNKCGVRCLGNVTTLLHMESYTTVFRKCYNNVALWRATASSVIQFVKLELNSQIDGEKIKICVFVVTHCLRDISGFIMCMAFAKHPPNQREKEVE